MNKITDSQVGKEQVDMGIVKNRINSIIKEAGYGERHDHKKIKEEKANRAVRKNKIFRDRKKSVNSEKDKSIMGTLIRAFLVPIALMIILGLVSYTTASSIIKDKVEEASKSTVSAMGMYCELLTGNVSAKALEEVAGEDLSSYYELHYKENNSESMGMWRNIKKELLQMSTSAGYIYSFNIIPEKGLFLTSTSGNVKDSIYGEFLESAEGKTFAENKTKKNGWFGYHTLLDEKLSIAQDKYALAFYQKLLRANAYLVLDIDMKTVEKMLDEMELGENSIKALVTPDGREIIRIEKEEGGESYILPEGTDCVFTDKEFYESSKETETGSKYVEYNGQKYLYTHAAVGKTEIMLCGLIPEANIIKEASFIRNLCIIMVIIGCVIAFAIGSRIAAGISKSVKEITTGLKAVAEGDLTYEFSEKRKDELGILSVGLNQMLVSIRKLMMDMKIFGDKVKEMSERVFTKTDTIHVSVKEIAIAVDEVAAGAQKQAERAELGNVGMEKFADKLDSVCQGAGDMGNTVEKATTVIDQGCVIVEDLNKKSETTVEITKVLVENIKSVQERSTEIEGFIETISSIAKQTNLLSLNASIEAARAGENGRGFAVVAEEIRKLADESMKASKNIKSIVEDIVDTMNRTTDSAQEAEAIVCAQAGSLEETIQVFGEINRCVGNLVGGLRGISESMLNINGEKEQVQSSIVDISVVSEQSAVATEEITATLDDQVKVISDLSKDVELLNEDADALEQSIGRFTV